MSNPNWEGYEDYESYYLDCGIPEMGIAVHKNGLYHRATVSFEQEDYTHDEMTYIIKDCLTPEEAKLEAERAALDILRRAVERIGGY